MLAINEFREFLSSSRRTAAPITRSSSSAMSHFYQMRGPMRDQTETVEAIRELTVFVERYPERASRSPLRSPEAQAQGCERREDRLGEHELGVGVQYYRTKWYPGAIER